MLADTPFVLTDVCSQMRLIAAANLAALKLGLMPGLSLAEARARVPKLAVGDYDAQGDADCLNRLADGCERFTPFVALDGLHGIVLDITGCAHLFGGEVALRDALVRLMARWGFDVHATIASKPGTARALCEAGLGRIVPAGEEESAVARLPVSALKLNASIITGLMRAGLTHIGALATQPRKALVARFGAQFADALDDVLGRRAKPIAPRRAVPDCLAERRFMEPLTHTAPLPDMLQRLAADLESVLERAGEGARVWEASFFRTDGQVRRIAVTTSRPVRDPKLVTRLLSQKLDRLSDPLDPGFGFDVIRLEAYGRTPVTAVLVSFDGDEQTQADISALIDQLSARFGAHAVQSFVSAQTHWPEAQSHLMPAQQAKDLTPLTTNKLPYEPPTRPLRLFERPERIEVMAQVPDGHPLRFRWRRALHDVTRAEGPERIAPEWWKHEAASLTRDYFRIEDRDGHRFWVFRDGVQLRETRAPSWFMHGLFA